MTNDVYGVELRNAAGKVTYSTEMSTWNYVASFQVAAKEGRTVPVPVLGLGFTRSLVQRTFLDLPPNSGEPVVHSVTVSGTSVIVQPDGNVRTLFVVLAQ
jgi:hypothetical protein